MHFFNVQGEEDQIAIGYEETDEAHELSELFQKMSPEDIHSKLETAFDQGWVDCYDSDADVKYKLYYKDGGYVLGH